MVRGEAGDMAEGEVTLLCVSNLLSRYPAHGVLGVNRSRLLGKTLPGLRLVSVFETRVRDRSRNHEME